MTERLKIQARDLRPGDVVASGEIISWIGRGARTPAGKVEVRLRKSTGPHTIRIAIWGAYTMIGASRATDST